MATYSRVLSDKTTLVLSSGSRMFKLLTEGVAQPAVKNPEIKKPETPAGKSAAPPKAAAQNRLSEVPTTDSLEPEQARGQP